MPKRLTTSGFTLLEIVVASAVFSVAMLVAVGLFTSVTQVQKRTQSLGKVQGDARFSLELMAQSVRVDGLDYGYYRDDDSNGIANPYRGGIVNLINQSTDELVTKAADSTRRVYRLYDPDGNVATKNSVIAVCERTASDSTSKCNRGNEGDPNKFQAITPSNIGINTFKVWISPASDPFTRPRSDQECQNSNYDESKGVCTCTLATQATDCALSQFCDESAGSPGFCSIVNLQPRATMVVSSSGGSAKQSEQAQTVLQTTVASRIYKR